MMIKGQLVTAIAVALAIPTILTGCVAVPDASITGDVSSAVRSAVPEAHDILVGISTDGSPDRRAVRVKVYIGAGGSPDVASIVDRVLKTTWASSPVEPVSVGVVVVEGKKPSDPSMAQLDGIDLTDAAAALGLQGAWVVLRAIQVPQYGMVETYGAWKAPK